MKYNIGNINADECIHRQYVLVRYEFTDVCSDRIKIY